jgi:hypothetical protein
MLRGGNRGEGGGESGIPASLGTIVLLTDGCAEILSDFPLGINQMGLTYWETFANTVGLIGETRNPAHLKCNTHPNLQTLSIVLQRKDHHPPHRHP